MNRSHADSVGFSLSTDNITIIIPKDAHYTITFGMGIVDTGVSARSHVAMRVEHNGNELAGSIIEEDVTNKNSDYWLGDRTTHAYLEQGDTIRLQYISDDTSVTIDQHDTYAETPFVASGYIQEVISNG